MQLVVVVLNQIQCLDALLTRLGQENLTGATILHSCGMAHSLMEHEDIPLVGSLRRLLEPEREESRTILMVTKDEHVPLVSRIVNEVTGGLGQPDTGILFALPLSYWEGLAQS